MTLTKRLIDTATIKIKAGNGGDGAVTFRREKYIPRGGPDGGDGGRGGSVIFEADEDMATLMDFRSKPKYAAQEGEKGAKKKMFGRHGEDLIIKVPVGTQLYELKDGKELLVADLTSDSQQVLMAQGGRGGKGNDRFKSSTNRTPRQYTPGGKGEEKTLRLEIKLIADIGLIGMPNAGKSTLINKLTNANAEVGNYPFTTLMPNLGVCTFKDGTKSIVADIPGLIEGASEGKGLGDDFLRHVERTKVLVHLIDPYSESAESPQDLANKAVKDYETIRQELGNYDPAMLQKPEIIVVNKVDVTEIHHAANIIAEAFKKVGKDVVFISGVSGFGLEDLKIKLMTMLKEIPEVEFEVETPVKVYNMTDLPNRKIVFSDEVKEIALYSNEEVNE